MVVRSKKLMNKMYIYVIRSRNKDNKNIPFMDIIENKYEIESSRMMEVK